MSIATLPANLKKKRNSLAVTRPTTIPNHKLNFFIQVDLKFVVSFPKILKFAKLAKQGKVIAVLLKESIFDL